MAIDVQIQCCQFRTRSKQQLSTLSSAMYTLENVNCTWSFSVLVAGRRTAQRDAHTLSV